MTVYSIDLECVHQVSTNTKHTHLIQQVVLERKMIWTANYSF